LPAIRRRWRRLRSLRKLLVGGEAFATGLAEQLRRDLPGDILNMYGPTETTIWSTTSRVTGDDHGTGAVDIGRPLANQQVYVLDANRQPLPVGVPGELWIAGDGVARGYLRRPELTNEKFARDPFAAEGGGEQRMYRTGDRVRFRSDGTIDFLGRVDHQVKLRGHRIELGEIEAALMQHSEVRQASWFCARQSRRSAACGLSRAGGRRGAGAECAARFPEAEAAEHMVPAVYVPLEKLPLTPNGKVDRKALPAPEGSRVKGAARFVAPAGGVEQQLAAIWKDILHVEQIGWTTTSSISAAIRCRWCRCRIGCGKRWVWMCRS
jgi:acyl-coenzyme A synthetase/AMP-(fatty) acid ligase